MSELQLESEIFEEATGRHLDAVIFDNDGTIADTHDMILSSFRYMLKEVLDIEPPEDVIMSQVGIPLADQMELFCDDPEVQKRMVDVYRQHNESTHDANIRGFAGSADGLSRLRDCGMQMAVATSKRRPLATRGLELLGILPYFDFVVGCEDTVAHKPEPEPLLFSASKLGVSIERCAYVGDATFDIRAAKAAGCTSIAVTWGMFDEPVLAAENPDYICHTFDELADLLVDLHG